MKQRCDFLDNLPAFNYNQGKGYELGDKKMTDTRHLGSTLMSTMLREVNDFCGPGNWSNKEYQQVRL